MSAPTAANATASVRLSVQIVDPSDDRPAEKGFPRRGGEYRSADAAAGLHDKRTKRWYMKKNPKSSPSELVNSKKTFFY